MTPTKEDGVYLVRRAERDLLKKEVAKSIASILAFVLVYFILIAASIGLVIAAFYAGITIISLRPGIYTILAGLGIIGAGVMVFVFFGQVHVLFN